MSFYLKLRWWVDRNWVEGTHYKSNIAIGLLPFLPASVLGNWWYWVAAPWALSWLGFVGWRGWRVARANDKHFDRKTKYMLSKEYHETESAMKASFKRWRSKRHGTD